LDCKAIAGYKWRGSNRAGRRAWDHQAILLICQFLTGAWHLAQFSKDFGVAHRLTKKLKKALRF
jgi:hypothetical protein